MAAAVYDGVAVTIKNSDYTLKANGTKMVFDGYTKIYNNVSEEDINKILPDMDEGMNLSLKEIKSEQSFTQPPSRFSEASLVKDLEEKSIGRPSTYAPIIATLLDRKYVTREITMCS